MAQELTFDPAIFRQQFPVFADPVKYPDAMLQMYWDMAVCYSTAWTWCSPLDVNDCRRLALDMLTAHLLAIATGEADGNAVGFVASATVDKVSVTIAAPTSRSPWQFWMNSTPYGRMYLAFLQSKVAGGFYIGGSAQRNAYRNYKGGFGPYGRY